MKTDPVGFVRATFPQQFGYRVARGPQVILFWMVRLSIER
jgi:hypothetical protein